MNYDYIYEMGILQTPFYEMLSSLSMSKEEFTADQTAIVCYNKGLKDGQERIIQALISLAKSGNRQAKRYLKEIGVEY